MISVVIPLFNKAHTITRTLGKVLEQTFAEYEVVIVNDGSTDNGVEVIRNFTSDSRIRIIEQENQGVSAARNKGVAMAKYDYIAFLDGDDEWDPGYLAKMKEAISRYPQAGLFCCAGIVIGPDGRRFYRVAQKYRDAITEIDFFENPHVFLHSSATVVLKSEFNKAGGFPVGMVRNEDYAFFFSLALITKTVYCGYPLSIYVGGVPGQATSTSKEKVYRHVIDRYNLVKQNALDWKVKNKTYEIFNRYEVRHDIVINLREKDYDSLKNFINYLHPKIVNSFSPVEFKLYKSRPLNRLGIAFILLTKLRWRLRGFPRISYK